MVNAYMMIKHSNNLCRSYRQLLSCMLSGLLKFPNGGKTLWKAEHFETTFDPLAMMSYAMMKGVGKGWIHSAEER